MNEERRAELESLIAEVVARVVAGCAGVAGYAGVAGSTGASGGPAAVDPAQASPGAAEADGPRGLASSFLAAGCLAHAGHAAGREYVLAPDGRSFGRQATSFAHFADLQPRLKPGALMVMAGLSLFELEALAEVKAGDEFAQGLVHVLGEGGRVVLGPDHRERFLGLKGKLSSRLWKALADLSALGVETAEADPRKAPRRALGSPARTAGYGASGPGREALSRPVQARPEGLRVVTVEDLRGLGKGSVLRLATGAIISPLARDEARARGISLEP